MPRLEGKVALITGGASGIGAACVRRFLAEGAAVIFTDINEAAGIAMAAQTGARFMAQDVADDAAWREIMAHIGTEFGRLDALMNNAGILSFKSIDAMDLESWNRTLAVNLTGTMLGCQHAIALMRKNPGGPSGAIINVSSIAGYVGLAGDVAYTATKGAIRLMTKSIAIHCARSGTQIRCNSLHPGSIDTPIHEPVLAAAPDRAAVTAFMHAMAPLGRMGTGDDIAAMAAFLASDDAAYITGTELLVDGGLLAGVPGF